MIFDAQLPHQQAKDLIELLSEDEILNRIVRGEKDLYALIIRRYNQRLYRIALSIMNNELEVEDVMQVAYIKAYENLDKFRAQSSFSTWITRILINECLMNRKKREHIVTKERGIFFPTIYQKPVVQTPLMKFW